MSHTTLFDIDDRDYANDVADTIKTFYPERQVTVSEEECVDPDGNTVEKIVVRW